MSQALRRYYIEMVSRERGTIRKDWGGKVTFCLLFPNYYRVGISNLGFQFVYALLNMRKDVVCERAFLPEPWALREHERTNTPLLSVESLSPLNRFDVLAFSLPYENDYPNVLRMLELGRIPLLSEQRGPHDPLVIAGGAAISMNPEPMAPFFDCILVGEAEGLLDSFVDALKRHWGSSREEMLRELARVDGVYVPSLYEMSLNEDGTMRGLHPRSDDLPQKVKRIWFEGQPPLLSAPLISPQGEFGESVLVEVARGCPYRCKFCSVRSLYHPFRPRSLESLKEAIAEGIGRAGKVGLLGAAVASHPHFEELCQLVLDLRGRLSVSSLRADRITPSLARILSASGQRTATLAPETGSEGLRYALGKHISNERLLEAVETLAQQGITNLRLYFMVGLPGEKEEDLKATIRLIKEIVHRQRTILKGNRSEITVSLSPFVPKPWTPFQWCSFEGLSQIKAKLKEIRRSLPGIRVHHDLPKWAYWEALFSLGDRRLGLMLYRGYTEGDWMAYFKLSPLNPDFWVIRRKEREETFPWEIVDYGITREDLWEELMLYEGR